MSNDLDDLIRQSANENLDDIGLSDDKVVVEPFCNHPWVVAFSWLLCAVVALFLYESPLPRERSVGSRSVETNLSVAMYHVAHRVETYQRYTGHLPEFLDPAWSESENVGYALTEMGYELTGKEGGLEIIYRQGDDPEELLHFEFSEDDQ
ncbi:MAG: hypothetical protein KDI36_15715 [Pseudomonadales bacterium]|nr:hypothetical protein [Pseudomonadales bacterium]